MMAKERKAYCKVIVTKGLAQKNRSECSKKA